MGMPHRDIALPPAPAPEESDEALMMRIAGGEDRAFSVLLRRHLPRTVGLAQRYVGDRALAEDIAQEAFSRVWTHAGRWLAPEEMEEGRRPAKFTSWFYRVVVNLCHDQHRKKRFSNIEDIAEPADEAKTGEELADDRDVEKAVTAGLDALPENQRMAMALCFFEGFSNAEAATAMGVSVKAVESYLVRARRALRESLAPLWADRRED
jgi:RNA polymerase sigma-70 factor (ECF subfamily)